MNKLYLVYECVEHESSSVLAVFNNREEAKKLVSYMNQDVQYCHYILVTKSIKSTFNQYIKHKEKRKQTSYKNWMRTLINRPVENTSTFMRKEISDFKISDK